MNLNCFQMQVYQHQVLFKLLQKGAQSMGISDSTGTIEKVKQADMLVLLSNPIENLSNTQNIQMIINNGKVIDKDKLILK